MLSTSYPSTNELIEAYRIQMTGPIRQALGSGSQWNEKFSYLAILRA